GGTLIVLSQQHGYEFNALSGGEVDGFGWLEDQSCQYKSVYISRYHTIFSGQDSIDLDTVVDGFFTRWPVNASILLTRVKNAMPAMLMYAYGSGRVIATTIYEDWAYSYRQSTKDGQILIRDIISWARKPSYVPEYSPGDSVNLSTSIPNHFGRTANRVMFTVVDPEKNVAYINETVTLATNEIKLIDFVYSTASKLGIYWVDYALYSDNVLIGYNHDVTSFAVSNYRGNAQGFALPEAHVYLTVTSDHENYPKNAAATFTFILTNTGSEEKTATVTWGVWAYFGWDNYFSRDVIVPATGTATFTFQLNNTGTSSRLRSKLYVDGSCVGYSEKGFWVIQPYVKVDITPNSRDYWPGTIASITAKITSQVNTELSTSLNMRMASADGRIIYQSREELSLSPYGSQNVSINIPIPVVEPGTYLVSIAVESQSTRIGYGMVYVKIHSYEMALSFDRSDRVYDQGDTARLNITLRNELSSPLSGTISVVSPTLSFNWNQTVSVAQNKTENLAMTIHLPQDIMPRRHDIRVKFSFDNSTRSIWLIVCPPQISLRFLNTTFSAGGDLLVEVKNTGGAKSLGNLTLSLINPFRINPDFALTKGETVNIDETKTIGFTLPTQTLQGNYIVKAFWKDNYSVTASALRTVNVTGILANVTISTDKEFYSTNESPNATLTVRNLDGAISGATVNYRLYSSALVTSAVNVTDLSDNSTVRIDSSHMSIAASRTIGCFTMAAKPQGGSSLLKIIYGWPYSTTSYTTIRMYPTDTSVTPITLVFGKTLDGNFSTAPHIDGSSITATWKTKNYDVSVTQNLQIVRSATGNPDTSAIKYTIENNDNRIATVAIRVMMDVQLSDNDGAPFIISAVGNITTEREFTGQAIPNFYQTVNNLTSPTMVAQGTLRGISIDPYRFVIAGWGGIYLSEWNYTINTSSPITSDSSVAIYYNLNVPLGSQASVVTFYGIGSSTLLGQEIALATDATLGNLLWSYIIPLNIDSSEVLTRTVTLPLISVGGRYILRATLTSNTSQVIAESYDVFYVSDRNVALSCSTDKRFYKPGETATLSGIVFNFNPSPVSTTVKFYLNGILAARQPMNITAGGQASFSWNFVVNNSSNILVEVDEFSVTLFTQMINPDLDAAITAPDIVDGAPFTAVVSLSNSKPVQASTSLNFNGEDLGSFTLQPYSSMVISRKVTVTKSIELMLSLSGEVAKNVKKTVTSG
ncbi:hypothetical protein MUP59_09830, partial [Candidatus Bathyarchaeota archaeon]|nr:hypothetical protein [Candidatus Bathyarchaeota archaeon]